MHIGAKLDFGTAIYYRAIFTAFLLLFLDGHYFCRSVAEKLQVNQCAVRRYFQSAAAPGRLYL